VFLLPQLREIVTDADVALEGAIWRGFDLTEMLLPCGILLSVGVLSFGLGARILSRRAF